MASSTYAQLLIVICVVVALSEVVTHNMPSNYFEAIISLENQSNKQAEQNKTETKLKTLETNVA